MGTLSNRNRKIRSLKLHLAVNRYDLQQLLILTPQSEQIKELSVIVCQLELAIKCWNLGTEKQLPSWAHYF